MERYKEIEKSIITNYRKRIWTKFIKSIQEFDLIQDGDKIALGHHFDDVIETILMGMLYGAQMQTMMPKVRSTSHPGMELIRPLYYVKEVDIINWKEKNNLDFIQCACRFTEHYTNCNNADGASKREEMKKLINNLRKIYKNVDMNIFRSAQNVNLDTLISYRKNGKTYHFLDDYDTRNQ